MHACVHVRIYAYACMRMCVHACTPWPSLAPRRKRGISPLCRGLASFDVRSSRAASTTCFQLAMRGVGGVSNVLPIPIGMGRMHAMYRYGVDAATSLAKVRAVISHSDDIIC